MNRLKSKMCWAAFQADLHRSLCVSQCRGTAPLRLGFLDVKESSACLAEFFCHLEVIVEKTSPVFQVKTVQQILRNLCLPSCPTATLCDEDKIHRQLRLTSSLKDTMQVTFGSLDMAQNYEIIDRPLPSMRFGVQRSHVPWDLPTVRGLHKIPGWVTASIRHLVPVYWDQATSAKALEISRGEWSASHTPNADTREVLWLQELLTVVNVVQVAPSAQGAFAADSAGAPQAHAGPSWAKNPDGGLDGSGGRCPELDDEGSAARILARWAGPPMSTFAAAGFGRGARYTGWIGWVNRMTSSSSDDETSRFTTSSSASPPIKSCSDSSDRVGDQ